MEGAPRYGGDRVAVYVAEVLINVVLWVSY